MSQFARIQNGIIAEIITADSIAGLYDATMEWVDVTEITGAAVGKVYDADTSTISDLAASAPAHAGLTKLQFRRLFTLAERVAIDDFAASTTLTAEQKAGVRTLQTDLSIASEVWLDDPLTVAGVQMLEEYGLISAGRATQILKNTAPSK
jgi:hypothetical protein